MASDSPADNAHETRVDSLKPAVRKRLDKLMEHGKQQSANGNFDYAHDMYASCVNKDPGNLEYVEAFFDNLQTKYNNNKKGGRGKGNRHDFKKAIADKQWNEAIELGLELLKYNPWDIPTLRSMAEACEALHLNEVELRYLKNALAAKPKDVAVNKHCAKSLARMGQFDQAVACWHRIEEISPSDKPEARQMISQLTMTKTRHATGMTDEELFAEEGTEQTTAKTPSQEPSAPQAPSEKTAAPSAKPIAEPPTSGQPAPEPDESDQAEPDQEELERAIIADPAELSNYMALAKLYQTAGELDKAEKVLTRAQAVSGNALQVQEQPAKRPGESLGRRGCRVGPTQGRFKPSRVRLLQPSFPTLP
jgi:tetratricopeptide (TPR) repeat protein